MPYFPPPAAADPIAAQSLPPVPKATRYYSFPQVGATGTITMSTTAIFVGYFGVSRTVTPASVVYIVTTAATGASVRGAIYTTDSSGEPDALVADLGSGAGGSTGAKSLSVNPMPKLSPGTYAVALAAVTAAPAIRAITGGGVAAQTAFGNANVHSGHSVTHTLDTGAWPATMPAIAGITGGSIRFDIGF